MEDSTSGLCNADAQLKQRLKEVHNHKRTEAQWQAEWNGTESFICKSPSWTGCYAKCIFCVANAAARLVRILTVPGA